MSILFGDIWRIARIHYVAFIILQKRRKVLLIPFAPSEAEIALAGSPDEVLGCMNGSGKYYELVRMPRDSHFLFDVEGFCSCILVHTV